MVPYKYSRDQLIAILRRNLSVYKDDETFVREITEMAAYLIEVKTQNDNQAIVSSSPKTERVWIREKEPPVMTPAEKTVTNFVASKRTGKPHSCKLCGATVQDSIMCPRCNGISR